MKIPRGVWFGLGGLLSIALGAVAAGWSSHAERAQVAAQRAKAAKLDPAWDQQGRLHDFGELHRRIEAGEPVPLKWKILHARFYLKYDPPAGRRYWDELVRSGAVKAP